MSDTSDGIRKSNRHMPFREQSTLSNGADEDELLNDVISKVMLSRPGATNTSNEVFHAAQAMLVKIQNLESKIRQQQKELNQKEHLIASLKQELVSRRDDMKRPLLKIDNLQLQNKQLQKQIHQMEEFLADYGMVWVGESSSDSDSFDGESSESNKDSNLKKGHIMPIFTEQNKVWEPTSSTVFKVDFDKLFESLTELNQIAGEDEMYVESTPDGARFKRKEAVQLTVYNNGLFMFNGPFRPFTDTATQQVVADIMDGYFPSELQSRFPEGIPFTVSDKRTVTFEDKLHVPFRGVGRALGEDQQKNSSEIGKQSSNRIELKHVAVTTEPYAKPNDDSELPIETTSRPTTKESKAPVPNVSLSDLLDKLPNAKMAPDGRLLDIKPDLKRQYTPQEFGLSRKSANKVVLLNTEYLHEMKQTANSAASSSTNPNGRGQNGLSAGFRQENGGGIVLEGGGDGLTVAAPMPKSMTAGKRKSSVKFDASNQLDQDILNALHKPKTNSADKSPRNKDDRVATLRIKTEKGNETFVLKMRPTDTIGAVRRYIDRHRGVADVDRYDIVQAFPEQRILGIDTNTLQDYGLVPNAALFLKRRIHRSSGAAVGKRQ